MAFYGGAHDAARRAASAQHMRMAQGGSHMPSNAGFASSRGHQAAPIQPVQYGQYYPQFYSHHAAPASPDKPYDASLYAPNTPDSTTSGSSYYSDSDVDAADAVMAESGLLQPTEMFDYDLMREMQELFTSPRASTSQPSQSARWSLSSQLDCEPAPLNRPHEVDSPWHDPRRPPVGGPVAASPTRTSSAASPVGTSSPLSSPHSPPPSQPTHFVPQGQGWEIRATESPYTEDTDMDEDVSDADISQAETMEMMLLMREIKFLEAQREFLDYKASVSAPTNNALSGMLLHHRDAIEQKRKLMEAQLLKDMFTKALNHQFENLRYVQQQLLESPITHYRNTLMTPMESYIHLTKDMRERRALLTSMREEKLDTARRFIEFQSRNIDVERDFFLLDSFEKFGKFYTVDFSISKLEDTTVDDVAFVFYFHFVYTKDRIAQILGSVENREYFDGIDWVFLHGRFVDRINLLTSRKSGRNFVVQEANTVFYADKIGDKFVMTCDNIDKDELHPYRTTGRIRKDMVFGVVVEPYVDSRGKESVLLKRFSFYRHHFNNIAPSPELMQAISTKVILWGQAVRMCVSSKEKDRPPMPLSKKPLKRAGAPMVLTNW